MRTTKDAESNGPHVVQSPDTEVALWTHRLWWRVWKCFVLLHAGPYDRTQECLQKSPEEDDRAGLAQSQGCFRSEDYSGQDYKMPP